MTNKYLLCIAGYTGLKVKMIPEQPEVMKDFLLGSNGHMVFYDKKTLRREFKH